MDRLPQKCFVASAGVHSLLMLLLVVGPAFLAPTSKPDNRPPVDVVSGRLIDEAMSRGGRPDGRPPAYVPPEAPAQPPPPVPTAKPPPEPVKQQAPQPPPEPVRPQAVDPQALEDKTPKKPRLPDVSTVPVRRTTTSKPPKVPTEPSAEEREAKRVAERNQRIAAAIIAGAHSLRSDMKPAINLEAEYGNGTGGPLYTSYDEAVRGIYWHEWKPAAGTATDSAVTKASIVIASDGTVLSARIINRSGDSAVDRSVQDTLDRVKYIAPFPEGAKDKQRTYTIKFDLKAKRLS